MSYTNNPRSILAGEGILVTPTTGTGAKTVTISVTGQGVVPVTIVTTTPYNAVEADYIISVNLAVPGAASVVLPTSPTGTVYYVKDSSGTASTVQPITVTGAGPVNIDGAVNAVIDSDYGSLTFVYDGTEWEVI